MRLLRASTVWIGVAVSLWSFAIWWLSDYTLAMWATVVATFVTLIVTALAIACHRVRSWRVITVGAVLVLGLAWAISYDEHVVCVWDSCTQQRWSLFQGAVYVDKAWIERDPPQRFAVTHDKGDDPSSPVRAYPLWPAIVLAAAAPTTVDAFAFARRRHRRLRGLCQWSAYNLTGNASGICPECGKAVPSKRLSSLPQ
jgi:hypothetical protein